jgi:hypothetical protein
VRWTPLLVALLTACGAAPTPDPFARYPSRQYLHAEGHGPDARSAEQDAMAGVARQISAKVRAELATEATAAGGTTEETTTQRVTTTAHFDRLELVQIVDARCAKGACVAWAVLDREKATRALRDTYEAQVSPFRAAADRALAASPPTNLTAYTGDLRTADEVWPKVAALARQIRVLGGGAAVSPDLERRKRLRAHREQVLSGLRVTILPGNVPPGLAIATQSALTSAFTALGMAAHPAPLCRSGLAFAPHGAIHCDRSALGPRCALPLTGTLRACGGDTLATVDLTSAGVVSVNPRSEQAARDGLAARLTGERLRPALDAQLRATLPLR